MTTERAPCRACRPWRMCARCKRAGKRDTLFYASSALWVMIGGTPVQYGWAYPWCSNGECEECGNHSYRLISPQTQRRLCWQCWNDEENDGHLPDEERS